MRITTAKHCDASIIQSIMHAAFQETLPRSSALDETVESIAEKLQHNEPSLIAYDGDVAVATVRYKIMNSYIYFSRLSVLPAYQGRGIAKKLLAYLEQLAIDSQLHAIQCKVRGANRQSIRLYETIGYSTIHSESIDRRDGEKLFILTMKKRLESKESKRN